MMLTMELFESARAAMREQPLSIQPDVMLIPPEMEPMVFAAKGYYILEDILNDNRVPRWITKIVARWWWNHRHNELIERGKKELS
jgi:hypothetical protein